MDDFKDILEEPKYKKYYKHIIVGVIVFIFIITMLIIGITSKQKSKKTKQVVEASNIETEKIEEEVNEDVKLYKVDIKGKINNPGVYELVENSRVIDVIDMAGGLLSDADTSLINLSKKITDEMVIIIYSEDEIKKQKEKSIEYVYITEECICPDNINDACITPYKNSESKEKENETNEEETIETNELVSINEATSEKLQTLPGIGEAKAKSIIEYRDQNGDFKMIEDIKNVSGIGEALYEKIKDYITV